MARITKMILPVRFHILLALLFMHNLCIGQPDVSDQNCSQEITVSNSSSCLLSIYIQYLDNTLELEFFGDLEAGEQRKIPVEVEDVFIYAVNDLNQQVAGALSFDCESMDLAIASCFVESSSYFDCENLFIRSKTATTAPRPVFSTAFASCGDEFEFEVQSDEPGLVLWTTPAEQKSVTMDDHTFLVSKDINETEAGMYTIEWFGFDGCYERSDVMLEVANCCSLRNELPQDTIICRGESIVLSSALSEMNFCTEEIDGFVEDLVRAEGNISDLGMFMGEADGFGPQLLREETSRETSLLLDFGELIPDDSEICFILRQGRCVGEFNSSNFELSAGGSTFSLRNSTQFIDEKLPSSFEEFCITTTEQTRFVRIEDLGNGCGIRVDAVHWRSNIEFSQFEYLWSTQESTETIEVNRTGTYSLQVTDCNGCKAYNEVFVAVESCETEIEVPEPEPCNESFESPIANPETFRACFGQTSVSGSVAPNDADPNGFDLQWDLRIEAINGEVDLSSNGNFIYTPNPRFSGIDQFEYRVCKQDFDPCNDENLQFQCATASVTIEIVSNQFSFQESQITACEGESVVLNVPDNFGVLWSTGSTFNSISVLRSGTFQATVTDANGCLAVDQIEVLFEAAPIVNVSKSNDIDCANGSAILSASGGDTYLWDNGQTASVISVNQPGLYEVTAMTNQGCTSTTSIRVAENTINVTAAISGSQNVCTTDESVVLSAFGGDSYQWSTGEANQSVTVVGPGIYEVTATDAETGCSSSTAIEIELIPIIADAGADIVACPGEAVVIGGNQVGPTNAIFIWDNGASGIISPNSSGRIVVTPTQTQTYTVQVTNNGCVAEDRITVFIDDFSFEASDSQTICPGESVVLSASGADSYLWSTGETTARITVAPNQSQTYSVVGSNSAGCSAERVITIDMSEPIISSISPNQVICSGETITIGATGGSVYEWSTGAVGSSITVSPDESTNYVVTITNGFGCQVTESTTVDIQSVGFVDLGPDRQVCTNSQVRLSAPDADAYLWNTGETSQVIEVSPAENQSYSVTISQDNCTATGEVFVEVISCFGSISGFVFDDLENGFVNSRISLFDSARNFITSTNTNVNGFYEFASLQPGNYILEQDDISGYINLSDLDESSDDDNDQDGANNIIFVNLEGGEIDADNNFREQIVNGLISGFAYDGNGSGLQDIGISLFDTNGNLLTSTITNGNGFYQFTPLPAGDYFVVQADIRGLTNISDEDESPDDVGDDDEANNRIFVSIGPRERDTDNNFRDEILIGTISGSAFDESGIGLSNTIITLRDSNGNFVSSVATNINGFYAFETVVPGDYSLQQGEIRGYANLSDRDESPDDPIDENDDGADNSIAVILEPGETDADNNFRDQLNRGVVSGFAFDSEGNGLANITISLFTAPERDLIAVRQTNNNGSYEFNAVPPGDYTIEQEDLPGFLNISDLDESPDDANDQDGANNIIFATVEPQENDTDNNFRDQALTGSISGFALDGAGRGLANIIITLKDLSGNSILSLATNNDGSFEFNPVAPGAYVLEQMDIPNYTNISDLDESPDDANDQDEANNMIFVTVETQENDADNIFRDQIITGAVSGFAYDEQGRGLPNVAISLFTASDRNFLARRFTNNSGFYQFTGLTPGDYTIEQTEMPGFGNISDLDESPDDVNDQDEANNIIFATVEPQENDTDNNFRDQSLAGTISGFAFDEAGNGLANIVIILRDLAGNPIRSLATNNDGSYEFSPVIPGEYTLRQVDIPRYVNISDLDESPDDLNDQDEANNIIFVTVEAFENDADNIFRDQLVTGAISGFALDEQGDGIANVSISLFTVENRNLLARRFTNDSGFYQFVSLEPAEYTIEQEDIDGFENISDLDESPDDANDQDGANNIIFATVEASENDADNIFRDRRIAVEEVDLAGSISGSSFLDLDNDGVGDIPFSGTLIFLLDGNGNQIQNTTVDGRGRYNFENIPVGDYIVLEEVVDGYADVLDEDQDVNASDQDGSNDPVDNRIPVTLSSDENDTGNNFVNSLLESRISGFVRIDLDGDRITDAPLEDVTVDLFDVNGVRQARTQTDQTGYYEFVGFEPGEYFLFELPNEDEYEDLYARDESISEFDPDGAENNGNDRIFVVLSEGEHDADNVFANIIPNVGTISGFVLEDTNNDDLGDEGIESILVSLFDLDNEIVATRRSASNGSFVFADIPPGDYYLTEADRVGFDDVSDFDRTDPDDPGDVDGVNDLIIVSIATDEVDDGNIFVNRRSQSDIIETCREAQRDDFSFGFGDFWRPGGSRAEFVENGVFRSPSGSILISDNLVNQTGSISESSIVSSSQNFESVNSLKVNLSYFVRRAENNDHFLFEVSTNGGASFTEIRRWDVNIDFINDEWNSASVTIPNDMLSSNTVLRIRSGLSAPNESLYLDDIRIEICFDEVDDNDDGTALTSENVPTHTIDANVDDQRTFSLHGKQTIEVGQAIKTEFSGEYTLFPNPTSNYLNIQLPSNEEKNVKVVLFDSTGKQVYVGQTESTNAQIRLDVQHLDSNQLYFIQIHNGHKQMQMLRFLKIN